MKAFIFAIFLFLLLVLELYFLRFPLFFLGASIGLLFMRGWLVAGWILFLSLVLDGLLVNSFGITALFVFGYSCVMYFLFSSSLPRMQAVYFVCLLLTSFFYSMVVEYSAHFGVYLFVVISYFVFYYTGKNRTTPHSLQWVSVQSLETLLQRRR